MAQKRVAEYGDFQTPQSLADAVCELLLRLNVNPTHVLEPTCGRGAFLSAAAKTFRDVQRLFGVEINSNHFSDARLALGAMLHAGRVDLYKGDFFKFDWEDIFNAHAGKWLILGNPPWVTTSALSSMSSENIPRKANIDGLKGIEAQTGKSNFDISEWMLLHHFDFLRRHGGWLAMVVKTSVARKLVARSLRRADPIKSVAMYSIDAAAHFSVSVDACLFLLEMEQGSAVRECYVFPNLLANVPTAILGLCDGHLVADLEQYRNLRHLFGREENYQWRSGVKHDCSKVMEFIEVETRYINGAGEAAMIEQDVMFPLLKSSDIANGRLSANRRMLVPQMRMGEDTGRLRLTAPLAWAYLQSHSDLLGSRGSSIYRNRPPFSIFGVGDYSFTPWKVAISGFYKALNFVVVGPVGQCPVLFDDTVYFLACHSEAEARFIGEILNSRAAQEFLNAMIFWSDKRPITADVLRRLSLAKLADYLARSHEYEAFIQTRATELQAA